MRIGLFIYYFLVIHFKIFGQDESKIYDTFSNGIYSVYVDNDANCPVSMKVDFILTNLKSSNGNNKFFMVPSKTKKYLITELSIITKGKPIGYSVKTKNYFGDVNSYKIDKDFQYFLPYKKGEKYNVFQGYNGAQSHKGENALDFTMSVGTDIVAIREGTVVQVVNEHDRGCKSESCKKYTNFVLIYHADGTFASYAHIQKDGNIVKVGDIVKQGDIIAKSGNTGYSTGPHLHLIVYIQKSDKTESLSTKFKIDDGTKTEVLKEGKTYFRNY
jgi:murein DD-endopeptidase MepM/ murein hydrolase activator NlpD